MKCLTYIIQSDNLLILVLQEEQGGRVGDDERRKHAYYEAVP